MLNCSGVQILENSDWKVISTICIICIICNNNISQVESLFIRWVHDDDFDDDFCLFNFDNDDFDFDNDDFDDDDFGNVDFNDDDFFIDDFDDDDFDEFFLLLFMMHFRSTEKAMWGRRV